MKRFWIYLLALLLALGIPLTAAAQELTGCTVAADSVAAVPGDTVTVPVRISGNPGFTNFAIAVKYDTAALKLERIEPVGEEENRYLCPETASANTAYVANEGDTPCGYITAASSEPVVGDGVLFTLTFTVLKQTPGEVNVEPELQYLRCADALTSVFASLTASGQKSTVQVVLRGDADEDGAVTEADTAFVYSCINDNLPLTDAQRAAADVNGDSMVDTTDAAILYRVVHGTLDGFPEVTYEEVTE